MNYKFSCVIDAKGNYKTFVLVFIEVLDNGTVNQNVQHYSLLDGETLINAERPNQIRPQWNGTEWIEGATADEISAWELEHPAPELVSQTPTLEERTAAMELAMLELMGGMANV